MSTVTLVYSRVDDLTIRLDIDFPTVDEELADVAVPAFVFFHGGGLIGGNRQSFVPMQLKRDILANGWAFISADYRLLIPCTGHDILADVQNLFAYLASDQLRIDLGKTSPCLDPSRLAVGGASAGAYVAYLAGIHARPKPKAVFGLYGIGGHLISPHYYSVKSPATLNVADFRHYLNPTDGDKATLSPTSDVPLAWPIPEEGEKARTSGTLFQVFIETGTFLDFLTGIRGLSESLRSFSSVNHERQATVPDAARCLFPELNVVAFPPTYLVHGTADQAALVDESKFLAQQLDFNRIPNVLVLAEGRGHGFNAEADADDVYDKYIKDVIPFFLQHVTNIS